MATVTRETISNLHDKVTVKLAKEDYVPSFEKQLKQYAKTINVPGFRKGMVPSGMVRKMYGQSIFTDEVLRAAGTRIEEYLREEKLQIFAQPMAMADDAPKGLDMNNPAEVDFSFEIGLKPEISIPELSKTSLTHYKVGVSDKLLDDEIVRLQRRFGKPEPQDKVTSKEDIIYSKFELCDADGNLVEGAELIEDTELMDKLPVNIQEQIMGKKADDSIIIQPKAVCTEEELPVFMKDSLKLSVEAAAENFYKMTLTKVSLLIPAELNEELYAQVFQNAELKDEKAFREMLGAELSKEYDRMSKERLQNEMYEVLVHNTPIDLPVDFLKRWMREGGEQPKSMEEVEKEFPNFDHQLRWTLISDKLIIDNDINVTRDEVLDDIKGRVLQYFGMGANDEAETPWMDDYMAKVIKDEKTMDETYRRLLFDKLFTFLGAQFNIVDKDIDEESFFKLQSAHDEHHHH